ncbi:MAG: hypothetical protein ACI8RD_004989 [Bacillariaceae sp.]|jgi:hypothetical protein
MRKRARFSSTLLLGVGIFLQVVCWTGYQLINNTQGLLITNQKEGLEILPDQFQYSSRSKKQQQQLSPKTIHDGIIERNNSSTSSTTSIPVFYNLFLGAENDTSRVLDIVSEQMALLRPEHKPVYIQSMGVKNILIPNTELLGYRINGTEMITLRSLWKYCKKNPYEKVVYLHSKGSSRNSSANEDLRKFLTIGALSEECSKLPQTCNVCSSRFSPLPHP